MKIPQKDVFLPDDWLEQPINEIASLCPIQMINYRPLKQANIRMAVKREDRMHPYLTGNKLYKLYYPLREICSRGSRRIVTFGGAYSNHLVAVAFAGQSLGLEVWGVIRGERPEKLSPTLVDAIAMGMHLHFVTRREYRCKDSPAFRQQLAVQLGEHEVIEEGGDSEAASRGCQLWSQASIAMCQQRPDSLCIACGTGGTAAGVLAGADGIPVSGYLVLKGRHDEIHAMEQNIVRRAEALRSADNRPSRFILETSYHGGGYARFPLELKNFMKGFEAESDIPLDPVYTGKLVWGVMQDVKAGKWPPGSFILLLHSGGLQGRRGFNL